MQMRRQKEDQKDKSTSSGGLASVVKRTGSNNNVLEDKAKDAAVEISSDSPAAMAKFFATRGAARGRSTKAAVHLQEEISKASKKIGERWAKLEGEWRALERDRKDSASTYGIVGGGGPIVELNVGGTDMDVLRTDLVRAEDSVLADMFSGRWEGRLPRDSRGRVFVDVSPTCFRKVVGFLVKLGIAKPGKVLELPTLTPDEQPAFDHLVLVLGLWPHVYEGKAAATTDGSSLSKQAEDELVRAPPVEPADARKFGQAVAQSFAAEEIALERAAVELQIARARFDREVDSINAFAGAPAGFGLNGGPGSAKEDDIVELNIGGTMAATRRSTLMRAPDSVLARMFDHGNEKRAPPFVRDTKGRYFVQYNDYCFAKIIEVLRSKRWPWPPSTAHLKDGGSGVPTAGGVEGATTINSRFRTYIREDEREDFSSLVSYFFPGCERFIMEAVGRVSVHSCGANATAILLCGRWGLTGGEIERRKACAGTPAISCLALVCVSLSAHSIPVLLFRRLLDDKKKLALLANLQKLLVMNNSCHDVGPYPTPHFEQYGASSLDLRATSSDCPLVYLKVHSQI